MPILCTNIKGVEGLPCIQRASKLGQSTGYKVLYTERCTYLWDAPTLGMTSWSSQKDCQLSRIQVGYRSVRKWSPYYEVSTCGILKFLPYCTSLYNRAARSVPLDMYVARISNYILRSGTRNAFRHYRKMLRRLLKDKNASLEL